MARKKKNQECPAGEKWAVPYADFLSLLLALFIALYAISATNTEKVEALKTEFIKIFDYTPVSEQNQPIMPMLPTSETQSIEQETQTSAEVQETTTSQSQTSVDILFQKGGVLDQVEEGTILKLPTRIYFNPSEATFQNSDLALFLKRVAEITSRLPKDVKIDVRGYAQNPNFQGNELQLNYELAMKRSMNVMQELIANGISPKIISFSSYGEFQPILEDVGNKDEEIKQNNRVEIYFFVPRKHGESIAELLKTLSDK